MNKSDMQTLVKFSQKLKVLIVDDSKDTQKQLVKSLKYIFTEITLASDGVEGLKLFDKDKFDIVISDINMPKMDGITMSEKMKNIDNNVSIIMLSGKNETDYFIDCIKIGVDGFLLKPLSLEQLMDILKKIVTNIQNKIEAQKTIENQQQYQKQKALEDMLNNITHHWRQPLSLISTAAGSIELTNEHDIATKQTNIELSCNIIKATETLTKMLDDFKRLFNVTYEHRDEYINFQQIIQNIVNQFDTISMITNIEDINIKGNKDLIENIIIPICNNAIEANKTDGEKFIFLDIFKEEDFIYITIKDNAGGIDEKIIDKIFDPYFSNKHKKFGVGLSLYFVYYIVIQYLKGTIFVSNETFVYNGIAYTGAQFNIKILSSRV